MTEIPATIPEETPGEGGTVSMCCRACLSYEKCRANNQLREDCCPQCKYFYDCMEKDTEEDNQMRTPTSRRYPKGKR